MPADQNPSRIEGVTVIGDILRPDGRGRPGGVDRPTAWLHAALRRQIERACGLVPRLLTPTTEPALAAWIATLRPPADADRLWAACHAALPPDPAWDAAIARLVLAPLHRQFCIGYELPPYLTRLLDRHAIPWLDIRLHPVRFLDDLIFAVRASDPATQNALSALAVCETEVMVTAGLREAMCRHIGQGNLPADTLLVIGQRPFDASQITAGRFFDARHHQPEIAALCAAHPAVVLKPHPEDPGYRNSDAASLLGQVAETAAAIPGTLRGVLSDNVYRLLAMPEITAILTVSSSVAHEAAFFGKTVHTLIDPPLRLAWRGEPTQGRHAGIDDLLLCVDFWRQVLAPHTPVGAPDGVRLKPKPNRLRIALDSFWSFNEIDTDRLPQPLPRPPESRAAAA